MGATIRSVTKGILGVAFIQSILAGLGFLVAGLPGAGFWAVIFLIAAILQAGVLVLIPAVIYMFAIESATKASIFLIWCIVVALIDNVLRPLLLGRGVAVPIVVVFLGAIGGFVAMGLIGLFVGAVVISRLQALSRLAGTKWYFCCRELTGAVGVCANAGGKTRRVDVSRARIKALLLILVVLVSSAGSVGTAGETHDRKNGLPDVLKATEITYPVKTITTGMVAFLVTVDADGIVRNSQILQDIPPLTAAAQEAMKNWTLKMGTPG